MSPKTPMTPDEAEPEPREQNVLRGCGTDSGASEAAIRLLPTTLWSRHKRAGD
jgi:hypothetical protein